MRVEMVHRVVNGSLCVWTIRAAALCATLCRADPLHGGLYSGQYGELHSGSNRTADCTADRTADCVLNGLCVCQRERRKSWHIAVDANSALRDIFHTVFAIFGRIRLCATWPFWSGYRVPDGHYSRQRQALCERQAIFGSGVSVRVREPVRRSICFQTCCAKTARLLR